MVRSFCPPCSQVGAATSQGLGSCLHWPSLPLQGGLPRLGLSPEPCAPSHLSGPTGNAEDLLLQALEQSCLEDHLLEAAWGVDPVPPEAPGESLCWVGVLGLAGFHATGQEQVGWQSPCGDGEGVGWGWE